MENAYELLVKTHIKELEDLLDKKLSELELRDQLPYLEFEMGNRYAQIRALDENFKTIKKKVLH